MLNVSIQVYDICYPPLDLKISFFESWLCFYMVVCLTRIIEYFVSIRPTFIVDARTFLETRNRVESLTVLEVKKLINEIITENHEKHV